jgi:hypothetical protein
VLLQAGVTASVEDRVVVKVPDELWGACRMRLEIKAAPLPKRGSLVSVNFSLTVVGYVMEPLF